MTPLLRASAVTVAASLALAAAAAAVPYPTRDVTFRKQVLTTEYWCDGINAADIDLDGTIDIIAGPFWYAGPDFQKRHTFYEPVPQALEKNPTNSMFTFPYDFNGDGHIDVLVLGRVLFHEAHWYENPGNEAARKPDARWKKHFVSKRVFGESPLFEDVDGDGKPELVSISGETANDKIKQWGWYAPNWSAPTQPWRFFPITAKLYRPWERGAPAPLWAEKTRSDVPIGTSCVPIGRSWSSAFPGETSLPRRCEMKMIAGTARRRAVRQAHGRKHFDPLRP